MRLLVTLMASSLFCTCLSAPAADSFDAKQVLAAADKPLDESPAKEIQRFATEVRNGKLALSANGKLLLVYGDDFQLYSSSTGKVAGKRPTEKLAGPFTRAALSQSGKHTLIASGAAVWLLDSQSGRVISTAGVKDRKVAHLDFLDDAKTAVVLLNDANLCRIDLESGKPEILPAFEKYTLPQDRAGAFSPDGRWFCGIPAAPNAPFEFFYPVNGQVARANLNMASAIIAEAMSDSYIAVTTADAKVHIEYYKVDEKTNAFNTFGFGDFQLKSGAVSTPASLSISQDEKWLLRVGADGAEVLPVDGRTISAFHYIDVENSNFAIAADAMRVATLKEGNVVVYQLPLPPESSSGAFIALLTRLVEEKRFDDLDSLGELLADDESVFPWAPGQNKYDAMVQLLISAVSPTMLKQVRLDNLDAWRKQKPGSDLAELIAAHMALSEGYEARGEGPAITVTPEGRTIFLQKVAEALEIVLPLLEKENPPPQVYSALFQIAKAQSWTSVRCEPHVAELLKRHPKYFTAHAQYSQKLMQRWGGEEREDQEFITRVADAVGGAEGDALYARLATGLAIYERPEHFLEVSKFDGDRVLRGWSHLGKSFPAYAATGELYMAHYLGRENLAKEAAARITKDRLPYTPGTLTSPLDFSALKEHYRPE